jgi:hypothetical protein
VVFGLTEVLISLVKKLFAHYRETSLDWLGFLLALDATYTYLDYLILTRFVCTGSRDLSHCKSHNGPTRDSKCSHCWDTMKDDHPTIVHNTCGNAWHAQCFRDWLNYEESGRETCSVCRGPLSVMADVLPAADGATWYWRPAVLKLVYVQLAILCGINTAAYFTSLYLWPGVDIPVVSIS